MYTPIKELLDRAWMHVPIDILQGSLSILGACAVLVAARNQAAFKIEKKTVEIRGDIGKQTAGCDLSRSRF